MKLLHLDSSARHSSVSRKLSARFAEEWKKNHPEGEVIYRDLSTTALPPITDDWGATYVDDSMLTPAQRSYLSTSDSLIEELRAADTVVIGAPMYNFSIFSLLKAWIDQVVRRGKTVNFGPEGPRGLLGGKDGCRHHLPRRKLRKRQLRSLLRFSGTLPSCHPRFHWFGRDICSRRKAGETGGRCRARRCDSADRRIAREQTQSVQTAG